MPFIAITICQFYSANLNLFNKYEKTPDFNFNTVCEYFVCDRLIVTELGPPFPRHFTRIESAVSASFADIRIHIRVSPGPGSVIRIKNTANEV